MGGGKRGEAVARWAAASRLGRRPGAAVGWLAALLLAGLAISGSGGPMPARAGGPGHTGIRPAELPLAFEENRGQAATGRFLARGPGFALSLEPAAMTLALLPSRQRAGQAVRLDLAGGNRRAPVRGEQALPGRVNRFVGRPDRWRTGVPTYRRIRASGVYPGIDVVYYGRRRQLEYDFIVAPGADPGAIRIAVSGARGARVDEAGDLVLDTAAGELRQRRPRLYQPGGDGRESPVDGGYRIAGSPGGAPVAIEFRVGPYDHSQPLVIDPVLAYSTYLGGSGPDDAFAVAADSLGNVYVTGRTVSDNFPTTVGAFDTSQPGVNDVFITKIDPTGTQMLYSTYLGGRGNDEGYGIAVDPAGAAYVTGSTTSMTDFPLAGPFQATAGSIADAFVTKLSASGSQLVYSTFLGGGGSDEGNAIVVDGSGNAVVCGVTDSTNFPLASAAQPTNHGFNDAFVAKLNSAGSALVFSTYLGGSASDTGYGVAVDGGGSVYATGLAVSADFPTTAGAFQRTGSFITFISKIGPAGGALVYSTYLGGTGAGGWGGGIAVDSQGNAYVTGGTGSNTFPVTTGAFQTQARGGFDAYVTKLNPAGSKLIYSTYLGGTGTDNLGIGSGRIAVDPSGIATVTGVTGSTNFPIANAPQAAFGGGPTDAFVTRLNAAGSGLLYSTYLGGGGSEDLPFYRSGIAIDPGGSAYVVGGTDSDNFPTASPIQGSRAGFDDGFVARLRAAIPNAPVNLFASGISSSQINLSWNDVSNNETRFEIERRTIGPSGPDVFTSIGSVGANVTSFSDRSLPAGTLFAYRLYAVGVEGNSSYSNAAQGATMPGPPAPPSNLTAAAVSQSEIDLSWNDNSFNETAFQLERRQGAGPWTRIDLGPDTTSYADTGLTPGTAYAFHVRSVNAQGVSAWSSERTATTVGFSVAGTISRSTGAPLSGVTVTAGGKSTSTAANGVYLIADLPAGPATITPSLAGFSFTPASRSVSLGPSLEGQDFSAVDLPAVSTLALSATSVKGGKPVTATVTLTRAVTANTPVALGSSNTAAATVPANVVVRSGASTAKFTVKTKKTRATTGTGISASLGGVTRSVSLTITP